MEMDKWMSRRSRLAVGGALLVALGAAGGVSAAALTRPSVEMAPARPIAIAALPQQQGIVTIRGKVAEVYGDRFVVADGTGRAMVDAGRRAGTLTTGAPVTVQGRYDDAQLRASFMVDANGTVEAVGRGPGRRPDGPRGDGPPPPPPPGGPVPPPPGGSVPPPPGGPTPPPPGCGPAAPSVVPPPPPPNNVPPSVAPVAPQ